MIDGMQCHRFDVAMVDGDKIVTAERCDNSEVAIEMASNCVTSADPTLSWRDSREQCVYYICDCNLC